MNNIVLAKGVPVSDEKVPAEKPKLSLENLLDYVRDPKNEPKIREQVRKIDNAIYQGVKRVDRAVVETGKQIVEAVEDESVAEAMLDDILGRFGLKADGER